MTGLYITLILLVCAIIGYLLGSISNGIRMSKKLANADVRDYGSHNSGGTNVGRVYGRKAGLITILLDMLKTIIAVYICYFGVKYIPGLATYVSPSFAFAIGGLGAIIGHCYPIYHKFRGGKAVASYAALVIACSWSLTITGIITFFLTLRLSKKVSLSSIVTSLVMTACSFLFLIIPSWLGNFSIGYESIWTHLAVSVMFIISAAILIYRHRTNIVRLMNGTENQVKLFDKKDN